TADRGRTRLRAALQDRCGAALRGLQPALRADLNPGHQQPALPGVDRDPRLRAPHRSPARPPHSPRSHPGDERRQLSAEAEQAKTPSRQPLTAAPATQPPRRTPPGGLWRLPLRSSRHPPRMSNNFQAIYWSTFTPPHWSGFTPPLTPMVTTINLIRVTSSRVRNRENIGRDSARVSSQEGLLAYVVLRGSLAGVVLPRLQQMFHGLAIRRQDVSIVSVWPVSR